MFDDFILVYIYKHTKKSMYAIEQDSYEVLNLL